jgi:hypothetical protein
MKTTSADYQKANEMLLRVTTVQAVLLTAIVFCRSMTFEEENLFTGMCEIKIRSIIEKERNLN